MSRGVEGDRLQDAAYLILDHSWVTHLPRLHADQLGELLVVLRPWFEEEFTRRRARVPARKPAKVDKGSQHEGRRLVAKRSGGWCEIAMLDVCADRATDWCHRRARSQGGTWSPQNGLHGCRPCHSWTHANPHAAQQNGWTVPSFGDPAERPVLRRGAWVLLDDDGGFEPVEKGAA